MFDQDNNLEALAEAIRSWGKSLGFSHIGIADTDLASAEPQYKAWIEKGFHGAMDYMAKHGNKRTEPANLVPGTVRVISARMDYQPPNAKDATEVLNQSNQAFISRYALGRDYHKVMRNQLQKLCEKIHTELSIYQLDEFQYRVFTDSAPVLEVALAEKAGLGWRGKHTLLITREAGSWFFIGEIYTNLPLPIDKPTDNHCGTCVACMDVCPTQAIVAPYEVDARRCISYLTIELKTSIPLEFRPLIGNRIYGCDDCQLACPWNRFGQITDQHDFHVRHGLDNISLVELFTWDQVKFNEKMAGSAIYRIGHEQWLRNIAVGLGNATSTIEIINALKSRTNDSSSMVREHVAWALQQHHITV